MKKLAAVILLFLTLGLGLAAFNYVGVYGPVSKRLAEDPRNEKVDVWVYRENGVSLSNVVFDLRHVGDEAAPADIFRTLFQAAEALKESELERVVLAHAGKKKFYLTGEHFAEIGGSFKGQNPMYLLRTLPEKVHKLDGSKAYGTWTGGLLAVVGKQMEDLSTFSKDWYLEDIGHLRPIP